MAKERFIPAPAGNTSRIASFTVCSPVHPRACGEHFGWAEGCADVRGSSPRLRGTRPFARSAHRPERFIPAPAGNTGKNRHNGTSTTVHPRACGEHVVVNPQPGPLPGSSPRLRGTHHLGLKLFAGDRFIPAPAGNTLAENEVRYGMTVHPRACGEHNRGLPPKPFPAGSSPRLRGTLAAARRPPPGHRFIPAPAGNTRPPGLDAAEQSVHPRACGEHLGPPSRHV